MFFFLFLIGIAGVGALLFSLGIGAHPRLSHAKALTIGSALVLLAVLITGIVTLTGSNDHASESAPTTFVTDDSYAAYPDDSTDDPSTYSDDYGYNYGSGYLNDSTARKLITAYLAGARFEVMSITRYYEGTYFVRAYPIGSLPTGDNSRCVYTFGVKVDSYGTVDQYSSSAPAGCMK